MLKQIQSLPANCHNRLYCCALEFTVTCSGSFSTLWTANTLPLLCTARNQQPALHSFVNPCDVLQYQPCNNYMFIHQSPCANFSHPDPCHMTHVIWKLLWVNMTCYWVTSIGMGNDMNWAMLIQVGIALKVEWWVLIRTVWWCHGSISGCSCASSHN